MISKREQTSHKLWRRTKQLMDHGYSALALLLAIFTIIWTAAFYDENKRQLPSHPQLPGESESHQAFDRTEAQNWLGEQATSFLSVLRDNEIPGATVYHRVKAEQSAMQKAARKHVDITQLNDLYGMRVVVGNELEVYETLNIICANYPIVPGTIKNYIQNPKPSGYRSVHVVAQIDERRVEFQLRTHEMHESAEAEHEAYKLRMNALAA